MAVPLLEAIDVHKRFPLARAWPFARRRELQAVSGVSFALEAERTLGLVGESGCGKSTIGRVVLDLVPPSAGEVRFRGEPHRGRGPAAWRALRRELQMVFQDVHGALDPRMPVAAQVAEMLDIHAIGDRTERRERALAMLEAVRIPRALADRHPHELSGGQRQRVVLARALVLHPALVVCDEPVSALDVSVKAQVMNLMVELKERFRLAYLFISHDLGVVRHLADDVAVMYLGQIVEQAPRERLFRSPLHPYSRILLDSVPVPDPERRRAQRLVAKGEPPSPLDPPSGCRFHPRCPLAIARCREEAPELRDHGGHRVRCHLVEGA